MVRKCKNILSKYQQPKISAIPRQDGFSTKRMNELKDKIGTVFIDGEELFKVEEFQAKL